MPASSENPTAPIIPPPYGREYLLVLLAAGVLYVATVAPGPLWQDNGLAQIRTLRHDFCGDLGLALSHPLYYVLTTAFQVLPFAESAYKTNLVASVCGAVTVANLYLLLRLLTGRRIPAIVGALSLAVAHTFWQHCALAEVYTVSTALLTAELLCLMRYQRGGAAGWLVLLFLANGLNVSNHMLASLDLPVWVVLLLWLLAQRRIRVGTLFAAGVAWLAGASIYLSLIVGEIVRGHPVGTVIRSALFGDAYAGNVLNLHIGAGLLGKTILYLGLNFPTPAALLGFVGLVALRRHRWTIAARAIGALLVIHLLWALHYNVPDQYTFFIPTVVLCAVVIGLGADRWLAGRSRCWAAVAVVLAALPPLVYLPLPYAVRKFDISLGVRHEIPYRDTYSYFLWPWKTNDDGPWRFATEIRDTLPAGAVLLADSTSVRPLQYLMATGRWRTEIAVWPRLDTPSDTPWPPAEDLAQIFASARVYVVTPVPGYCPGWLAQRCKFVPVGIVFQAQPLP